MTQTRIRVLRGAEIVHAATGRARQTAHAFDTNAERDEQSGCYLFQMAHGRCYVNPEDCRIVPGREATR